MQLFGVTAVEFYPNGFIKRIEYEDGTRVDTTELARQFERPAMACHCCHGSLDTGSYTIHGNIPAHFCAACFTELVRVGVIKTEG